MARERILTGMRPTGPLHIGHYVGALENWVRLQNEYECYFLIADYQALGDFVGDIERIRQSVKEVTLDWLAVGLDPNNAAFVIQSYVPEHAELTMLLSMITPLSRLEKNPTLKTEMAQLRAEKKQLTVGFYNYPVSQIADILLPRAHLVPVGEDQVPHIEDTREIARKFNRTYQETFPEPLAKVGRVPRLVGIDGQAKMSKSLNNAIFLSDDADTVRDKVRRMVTDPTGKNPRLRPTDPGIVGGNPVFEYLDAILDTSVGTGLDWQPSSPYQAEVDDLKVRYRAGRVGDKEVKDRLAEAINEFLDPIRERRAHFEARPGEVEEALLSGSERERKLAQETIQAVREAMQLIYF